MILDWQVCSRARLSRDARFDGKFFIGVLTSKVYCRSICPAPTAKEKNVRYYPTAAAAAEAGFRPCLRCRPECSPGTPAWLGTPSTVLRALRLIAEGDLQEGGMEALAERLGIGARHLGRLFLSHLGATPGAVIRTCRLNFAKKLIDETNLPMGQIAFAANFGCVRRFNAAILKGYHRTPTQLRHLSRCAGNAGENQYLFRLRFRPPYHWPGVLAFLAARATPGTEVVEGGAYRRSISLNGHHGCVQVSLDECNDALAVRLHFGEPRLLLSIIERLRAMFDLNADWAAIAPTLQGDPMLAPGVTATPGLRVPGCWDGFELATRAILGQHISVKAATALAGRIVASFGRPFPLGDGLTHLFPTPQCLEEANLDGMGLPRARAESVRALARAVCGGKLSFDGIIDSEAFPAKLSEISGIGRWTAQYVAMRALGDSDAFPVGDVALLRSTALKSFSQLEERAEAWRPWRAYAAMYLWNMSSRHGARVHRPISHEGRTASLAIVPPRQNQPITL
jgi:AraC family transcriptional regulator of adaptative response / DNA-3-methyladenine glycosylase II